MKKFLNKYLFAILVIYGCSEKTTNPIENNSDYTSELEKLLPITVGNSSLYNIDTLNKKTNEYVSIGERTVEFENKITNGNATSYSCNENYIFDNNNIISTSLIKFTENTIEFLVDTNGISDIVADSIKFAVQIKVNETAKIIQYPYGNEEWLVFKAYAEFAGSNINIFSITGKYDKSVVIQLPGFTGEIQTEKFIFNGVLNIPDINNPFLSTFQKYEAHLWVSPDLGIVKAEGFALFLNPIFGKGLNIADSSKVIRHTLISVQ